ncbi:kunitz type trypsin inhibitor 111 [Ricinus communis]|uniref:Alpha-amylase/subtilisin inhibitor, putative n=1 Tax=Ricinus communis TaxID=3988 RepID=B9SIQ2_RICCO|nr:kunitz type trypsin inhibitor 111 [Ricinus communis]EEF36475.1 Alpha-amylase/subtilisin inhibitor precursor, putative [Ricinus communis]|eukprot:XP_002525871.1 alpha-amylase/subtilisin inhibitor [Ricinus communis]
MVRSIGVSLGLACLLMAVSTIAQTPAVLDSSGQPLTSGVEYYVLPAATDTAGGLTLVNRTGSCPFYVGQEPLPTVAKTGFPVIFTPLAAGESIIREGMDFRVAFSAVTNCVQSTTWSIGDEDAETSRRFIVTGGEEDYFRIDKNEGLYNLGWCPNCNSINCPRPRCGFAGILIENGNRLLALDGAAFPFQFRRA